MTHHIRLLLPAGLFALAAGTAEGHGYLSQPPARNLLCKQGINTACGAIQYEPQSLEGLSGFPAQGPADGRLASAGLWQFSELDVQTRSRWVRQPVMAGRQVFRWTFTANHVTRNFRYYLTRPDWNPDQPLTRNAFELVPFCTVDGQMQRPPMEVQHTCTLPPRSGYQIVLAVWEIGDTVNSFYNLIDVDYGQGSASPTPTPTPTPGPAPQVFELRGAILPSTDLAIGDTVRTRVFDAQGERPDLATSFTIAGPQEKPAAVWSYRLAEAINQQQSQLRAGTLTAAGEIVPGLGTNLLYVRADSGITRVETQIDRKPPEAPTLTLEGVPAEIVLTDAPAQLPLSISARGLNSATVTLTTQEGTLVTSLRVPIGEAMTQVSLDLSQVKAGLHTLVVVAQSSEPPTSVQKSVEIRVIKPEPKAPPSGSYDALFPAGLSSYRAGTRVLQPVDGRIYECRPWPYSGYCVQWSKGSNQFEPGVGSAWQEAWILR